MRKKLSLDSWPYVFAILFVVSLIAIFLFLFITRSASDKTSASIEPTQQAIVEEYELTSIELFARTANGETKNYIVYSFLMPNGSIEARSKSYEATSDTILISENVTIEFKVSDTNYERIVETYLNPEGYWPRYANKISLVFWLNQNTYDKVIAKDELI